MDKQYAMSRILQAAGVYQQQIDLVDKVLALEKDREVIRSVSLSHQPIEFPEVLSADVLLKKDFVEKEYFKQYLKSKDLPTLSSYFSNGAYILRNSGVLVRFIFPDDYKQR